MDLKKWFNDNVWSKVLSVLDGIANQFKDKDGNPDWRKAVTVFSQFADNTLQGDLKTIVDKVIDTLKLSEEVDTLRGYWQKIPADVRTILTTSLEEKSDAFSWALLGQDGKGVNYGDVKGPWNSTVSFGAGAELALGLHALANGAAELQGTGLSCLDNERILKMDLAGKLALSAGGNLPVGFIGIKGGVATQGTATLDYYYKDKAKWLFIESLIHNVPRLSSPFDAADIAKESAHRLSAIQLNVAGSLNASFGISAGKTLGTSFNVKSDKLDLNTEVSVGAEAKVSYEASLDLQGYWDVLVKPIDTQKLSVKVQKASSKTTGSTFILDTHVGIKGLDVVGNAVVKKYMPDATPLLNELGKYLNFGDVLKQELVENMNDLFNTKEGSTEDSFKKELTATLVGDGRADQLSAVLGNAASSALNKELDLLQGNVDKAGAKLTQSIADQLKLPGGLGAKLVAKANEKMDGYLANIRGKLQNSLQEIISKNQGRLTELFKPLEQVGVQADKLVGEANTISQEILGPVISYLNKYQDFRNKIVAAVAKSSDLKLSLYVKRVSTSSSSSASILEFELDTAVDKACEYYRQMLGGNFKDALTAARAQDGGSDGVVLTGGSFQAAASKNVSTDVSLNIFGAQFSSQTIMKSDVQVKMDVNGNVLMATSDQEFKKVFSALGETRSVQFVNSFELPGVVSPDGTASPEIKILASGLTLSYKDESMKPSEMEAYLGSLKEANLVSPDAFKASVAKYNELVTKARGGKNPNAEIGVNMAFTSKDIQSLMAAADDDIVSKAINSQLNMYLVQANPAKYQEFTGVLAQWNAPANEDLFTKIRSIAAKGALGPALNKFAIAKESDVTDMNSVSPRDRHYINMAFRMGSNAANLLKIVQNIRSAAKMAPSEESLKDNVNTLNGYNNDMNKYLKDWLEVGGILKSLGLEKETVPAVTLAFIATIGELCQLGDRGTDFLIPTVKWNDDGGQPMIST